MFVKNNNILFCLDDCLLCFEIGESCVLLHMHMESGLSFFLKHVITRRSCSCLVLLFLLLCSSCLVKNSSRGIILD